jgi:hypothetical protein
MCNTRDRARACERRCLRDVPDVNIVGLQKWIDVEGLPSAGPGKIRR